jgi:acetyl esterase/lipase
MRNHGSWLLMLALGSLLLFQAEPTSAQKVTDGIELVRDVEYGKGGGRPLRMHLLRPKAPPNEPMPVLVWIHGGAWSAGSRDSGINRLVPYVQRGYFGASIEYRFSQETVFPAQIEDAKCAIRFLRAKAGEYNLDPERIGVWGSSAGGHLVALLGTSGHVKELEGKGGWAQYSSRVQAVCDYCGPADLIKWGDEAHPAVPKLLGAKVSQVKDKAALASPVTHIGKDLPPFLIVHGDKDATVPVSQSESLYAALKKAGADVTLHVVKGGGHGFGSPEIDSMVATFFDKHLKRAK